MAQQVDKGGGLRLLDPREVRLDWDAMGYLRAVIGGQEYARVRVLESFPLSSAHCFVALRSQDGEEIGMLEDAASLDRDSRRVLEAELDKSYFIPKIIRIRCIDEDLGVPKWDVETDRGPRAFELGTRQDAHSQGRGRVLIKDIDGNRYEIPNWYKLDGQSRALLEEEL